MTEHTRSQKPIKVWGGFVDSRLGGVEMLAIYRTKRVAHDCYEDVRPVWITFTEPKDDGDD